MLEHGGNLSYAAHHFGRPLHRWLDLSTGINPHGWPVPPIPPELWQRLPQEDTIMEAAQLALGLPHALTVAGSQAAIQTLPRLRPRCRVGISSLTYAEHAASWLRQGHEVIFWSGNYPPDDVDILIIINPNNPTGSRIPLHSLWSWHANLAARGGWLIVDEAFMDATPEDSLLHALPRFAQEALPEGLIILRSLGKFFGLAGARVGMVGAAPALLERLADHLGPWPVSAPSRWIASQAWSDTIWQESMRNKLSRESMRLQTTLERYGLSPQGSTALFQWVVSHQARSLHEKLAHQGIWTRHFPLANGIRFGLPGDEPAWQRLNDGLALVQRLS